MMHTLRIRPTPPLRVGIPIPPLRTRRWLGTLSRTADDGTASGRRPDAHQVKCPSVSEIAWGLASDKAAIFLAVMLIIMTILSAGPLHPIDNLINNAPRPFWQQIREPLILWPDTVASRFVALPVLGATALQLSYWYR